MIKPIREGETMKRYAISCAIALISNSVHALYNEPVTTRENQEFIIKLANTKGTGYEWTLENEATTKNYITLISSTFESYSNKTSTGTRGQNILTFKALRPGRINLKFAKKRSWEQKLPPAATKNVNLIIKKGR